MKLLATAALLLAAGVSAIKNPVLPGWNPDPAILRVDDTYYMAVSSFTYYPGVPIYKSKDLANWELVSHALKTPDVLPLYGISAGEGVWAPSFSHHDGLFYITSMTRWGSDPDSRTWPRIWYVSSPDLVTWSDLIWAEPYGIDPDIFHDPVSGKDYLNLMGPNNNYDRLWGITQCEIDLKTGRCVGPYRNIWNGTLPQLPSARPEGPKMFRRGDWYYLVLAEGGTSTGHRATVGRSKSPEGPWESSPTNPLIYNGADQKLTVQSTGHATFTDTVDGEWYASLLARRNVKGASPLGREAFLVKVDWEDDWPTMNGGEPLLLSQSVEGPDQELPKPKWADEFDGPELGLGWYQTRTPYTQNFRLKSAGGLGKRAYANASSGIVFHPNVFTLGDRDTAAAVLHKQTSLNMTFSAKLLSTSAGLGPRQSVGISSYLSEVNHQDIGVRGCWSSAGLCVFVDLLPTSTGPSTRPNSTEYPLNLSKIPADLTLHIRATPLKYSLGYSHGNATSTTWLKEFNSKQMGSNPGYPNFEGSMFALFASGNGEPWPYDAPEVGFQRVEEVYYEENLPDYDNWS
ncbi:Putative glycoside hydrolase, family 43, concanavalin A-like lectin/glucanase domain superfamily [Colletotrichum destructivum]|uniref:Glycoside hydrolase, family 43, concanavalin A-like lectin/glucanase domain superfamily n=1 Tax=Colletotrichum destructivum TaxID=34406 RepID=A0AAX4I1Z1_9PEZI|nr:Putative glycoside hydrolase, family 43, concanavalin A-like lectin/glucanase domain superfamily [Colletotrichum destructivum]